MCPISWLWTDSGPGVFRLIQLHRSNGARYELVVVKGCWAFIVFELNFAHLGEYHSTRTGQIKTPIKEFP